MFTSLTARILVPFGVGLAVIGLIVGVGSTLSARAAAGEALELRADTAARLTREAIVRTERRLGADARVLAGALATEGQRDRADLEARLARIAIDGDLSHVALFDAGGRLRGVDGREEWTRLPVAERLRRDAIGRSTAAVSERGEPLVLAAASAGGTTMVLGRAIDRSFLQEVEEPVGVLLHVDTGARRGPAKLDADGTETFTSPLALGERRAELQVTISNRGPSGTTWSVFLATGGAAVLVGLLLLGLLRRLLRRSVLAPLDSLGGGIRRMRDGDYASRLPLAGASELRALSDGFNDMAGIAGAQRARLVELAATDPLTGLANHRHFHEALERALAQALRDERSVGVVVLDLDHFRALNEQHGHAYGDEALCAVASLLRGLSRDGDLVGRTGGEEFVLLLPSARAATALEVAERVRSELRQLDLRGHELDCSAGVAAYPEDTGDGLTLLELARVALHSAKAGGRGQCRRYDARHMTVRSVEEQREEVWSLLDHDGGLVPVFQPIVDLATGRVAGYEALSRFNHASGRGPEDWFTFARQCGLSEHLQSAAIANALSAPDRPAGTYLSLNLDPSVLGSPRVEAVLPRDLSSIVIEITEQELIPEDGTFERQLEALRSRGAGIALDDAGAGYAGLQRVMRVRPDLIKLDRALVAGLDRDPGKLALVESFTSFARRIGAQVCAEGIESEEELAALADLDVPLGQGYLLARPAAVWPAIDDELGRGLLARAVNGEADAPTAHRPRGFADLTTRLAGARSVDEMLAAAPIIASELGADQVVLWEWDADKGRLESLGHEASAWEEAGAPLDLVTIAAVLGRQQTAQVLADDDYADRAHVERLEEAGFGSLLLVPVVARGEALGLMALLSSRRRPWSRDHTARARIVGHQLGAVLEDLHRHGVPA